MEHEIHLIWLHFEAFVNSALLITFLHGFEINNVLLFVHNYAGLVLGRQTS